MRDYIDEQLKANFYDHPDIKIQMARVEQQILKSEMSQYQGADFLLGLMKKV